MLYLLSSIGAACESLTESQMKLFKNLDPRTEKKIISFLTWAFVLYSASFIYRTSFIAIDGKRYFCLFDDAMISMRYAWNFSHGMGLVWNAGEHVQGYTNLLMTLVMSVATLVFDKSEAALVIQILGIGMMLAIAHASMSIANFVITEKKEEAARHSLLRIVIFLFSLSYYPLIYWTLTGMETGLLTVLLLFSVLSALHYAKSGKFGSIFTANLFLSLAFLTRNDSLILAFLIWLYLLWEIIKVKRDAKAAYYLFISILLYIIVAAGEFLFQYFYYGEFLPNTYTLKLTGMSLSDRLSNGWGFSFPFLVQVSFLLLPALADLYLRFQKEKLLLLSLFLSTVAYQIYVGGDPWNYWRMMSPTIPLLGILFIGMMDNALRSQSGHRQVLRKYSLDTQIALISALAILVVNAYFLPEILFLERPFYVSANQHNVNIALALEEVTTQDATVGVFWAGAIPYFTERNSLDFLGKSDRYIAHLPPDLSGKISFNGMKSPPGHNKYDLEYSIKQLQPTYVQDFVWGTQDLTSWAKDYYVEVNYKGVELFLLKGSPTVLWEKVTHP